MTQPQLLNVDKEELEARAGEVEAAMPAPPSETPVAPCDLPIVKRAAEQLALSVDNMRLYLGVGERERRLLAESLRNAAKAYEDADEGAGEALAKESSVPNVTPDVVEDDADRSSLEETRLAMTESPSDYADLKQRFLDVESGDQGIALSGFADAWEAYQQTLLEARDRFRPFEHWDGEAAYAVEQNFDEQRNWLSTMARLCAEIVKQARDVVSTQRWALAEHVWYDSGLSSGDYKWTYPTVVDLELQYNQHRGVQFAGIRQQCMKIYAGVQKKSDELIVEYERRAALPLSPLNPPKPPDAYRIDPPADPDTDGPDGPDLPGDGDELPLDDFTDPTTPATPFAGMPTLPKDAAMSEALKDALKAKTGLPGGPKLKPASFGGGGGVPALPLQPSVDSEAVARPGAGSGASGLGRAMPGAGGPMGSGMGMAPMVPPGTGQGQNGKEKRAQQEQESLYTEERPWTEGVIGNRPRKAASDSKDSK